MSPIVVLLLVLLAVSLTGVALDLQRHFGTIQHRLPTAVLGPKTLTAAEQARVHYAAAVDAVLMFDPDGDQLLQDAQDVISSYPASSINDLIRDSASMRDIANAAGPASDGNIAARDQLESLINYLQRTIAVIR